MNQQRKFILIANCLSTSTSGPANIVRGLAKALQSDNIMFTPILRTEHISKLPFMVQICGAVLGQKKSIVNVHTDGFLLPLLVFILSFFNRTNSYYLTVHGIYEIESQIEGRKKNVYFMCERILYKHFPHLICVSEMLREDISSLFGRTDNVLVIPNATDASSDKPIVCDMETFEIVSLGGLRRGKGVDRILNLASCLSARNIDFHVSIYGPDGGNVELYSAIISERGLTGKVDYYGNVTDKQAVYDIIRQSAVQLCLSEYDTYNVAIAESLVLGCACIASDRCGASYLINDYENGLVVNLEQEEKTNYDKSLEYILHLRRSDLFRKKIFLNREKYATQLAWKTIANSYLALE